MERNARSNLKKLLFADDESVALFQNSCMTIAGAIREMLQLAKTSFPDLGPRTLGPF